MYDTISSYFELNQSIDIFHFTSDGWAWQYKKDAVIHAKHLQNDTITTITREEIESEIED